MVWVVQEMAENVTEDQRDSFCRQERMECRFYLQMHLLQ
jgi:hypothetical protein